MPPNMIKMPKQEKLWNEAKEAVEESKDKSQSSFSDQDWGLVNMIYQKKKEKHSSLNKQAEENKMPNHVFNYTVETPHLIFKVLYQNDRDKKEGTTWWLRKDGKFGKSEESVDTIIFKSSEKAEDFIKNIVIPQHKGLDFENFRVIPYSDYGQKEKYSSKKTASFGTAKWTVSPVENSSTKLKCEFFYYLNSGAFNIEAFNSNLSNTIDLVNSAMGLLTEDMYYVNNIDADLMHGETHIVLDERVSLHCEFYLEFKFDKKGNANAYIEMIESRLNELNEENYL